MFNSLTKREKILAIATAAALCVTVLFIGFFWFMGRYNDNVNQMRSIEARLEKEQARTRQAMAATRRKAYYSGISITSDIDDAKNQYIAWLTKILRYEIGVDLPGVDPERTSEIQFEGVKVASQMTFSIRPKMTLAQLTQFLEKFYSVNTLHRIASFKLTPQTEIAGRKKVRTGLLSTSFEIQVLALTDAGKRSEFGTTFRDTGISESVAQETIVRRDIFGPANNSPAVKVRTRSSYESNQEIRLGIDATDADKDDELVVELISKDVDPVEFEYSSDKKSGQLKVPGQPAGSYTFVFRVTDNGLPARSTEEKVTVRFKDPVVKVVKTKPKPPPVAMAEETRITANLKDRDGNWTVMIQSLMDGKSYRLKQGEQFELDGKQWFVTGIDRSTASFRVGEQFVTLKRGQPFASVDVGR